MRDRRFFFASWAQWPRFRRLRGSTGTGTGGPGSLPPSRGGAPGLGAGGSLPSWLDELLNWDCALLVKVGSWRKGPLTVGMRLLALVGEPALLLAVGLLAGALGAGAAALWVLSIAATLPGVLIAKRLWRRPRPGAWDQPRVDADDFAGPVGVCNGWSFPSAHAAGAAAAATAAATLGWPVALLAALLASGVAASRVYLGHHYPLDVVMGAAWGTCVALLLRGFMV